MIPNRMTGNGVIARTVNALIEEVKRLQPVRSSGTLTSQNATGVTRSAKPGSVQGEGKCCRARFS